MSFFSKRKSSLDVAVATCNSLIDVVKAQTEALRAQNTTLAAIHSLLKEVAELKHPITTVATGTTYLANAQRATLQRSGHKHDF